MGKQWMLRQVMKAWEKGALKKQKAQVSGVVWRNEGTAKEQKLE